MRKRNKIASIALFLAALVVTFDAQPGWSKFKHLNPAYHQCDISFFAGVAVLPDHTLLGAANDGTPHDGLYQVAPLSPVGDDCTTQMTKLNSNRYQTLTIGLDGRVYSFKLNSDQTHDLVVVNLSGGDDTILIKDNAQNNNDPLGVALDPISGDLFLTHLLAHKNQVDRIVHLYDGGTPTIEPSWGSFSSTPAVGFDGLAWSCDGTTLLVASSKDRGDNRIIKFTRNGGVGTLFATLAVDAGPDGIVFGAQGTPLQGYVFSNNNDGTVDEISSDGTQVTIIASGGDRGDWIFLDNQGDLLLIQGIQNHYLTRLSQRFGGRWVSAGSSLCADLGCGAQAATTPQIDHDNQACLVGLDATLVLTLSESACGGCDSCNTLNQARSALNALLESLHPPPSCVASLTATVASLSQSCPCNPNPLACTSFIIGVTACQGDCISESLYPAGFNLKSSDPVLKAVMQGLMSP